MLRSLKDFNKEFADYHIYCGRQTSWKPREGLINGKLGNPYKDPIKYKAILNYEKALKTGKLPYHIKAIERIAELLINGKHVALYCFCKPYPCHIDVISKEIKNIVLNSK